VIMVYGIYTKWGIPKDTNEPKWLSAVKILLFFFIPLLFFDALFQTGVIETVIRFLESVKIF
ncbi:MAG: hypothetical protein AB1564_17495, partial [Chloroflexota bacterium]